MMSLDQIVEELREIEGFHCGENGASESKIKELEVGLNVALPQNYRHLLSKYGYLEWFGHTVCGIGEDNEVSAYYFTEKARRMRCPEGYMSIPRDGVVIEQYSGGGFYFLFDKRSERAGGVALFTDEAMGRESEFWETFEEFLNYKLSLSTSMTKLAQSVRRGG